MRRRAAARVAVLGAVVSLGGCGGGEVPDDPARTATTNVAPAVSPALGPVIDPAADRWSLRLDDDATLLPLAARSGGRVDHKVPARLLQGRHDANLVRAAIAGIWTHDDPGNRDNLRALNADQRAVYALAWAGVDLGHGGFVQLTGDNAAAPLLRGLREKAIRVGAPRALVNLLTLARSFQPERRTRDDWARLDNRYATLQRHRDTALAHVLAAYIARHRSSFATGA